MRYSPPPARSVVPTSDPDDLTALGGGRQVTVIKV